jgi:hypothetical protein
MSLVKRSTSSTWLSELPMELVIEIMTYLDYLGLESLVDLLDRPLPGVVQYVVGPLYLSSLKLNRLIETVQLDELGDFKPACMISLINFWGH